MSEIQNRDEFVLIVNRLMICAMEDIDCGRNQAGAMTLDLVQRIEDHDRALRAENERLEEALRRAGAVLRADGHWRMADEIAALARAALEVSR